MKEKYTILAASLFLLVGYIVLTLLSMNCSIELRSTDIIVNGKIVTHEILDYPTSKKIYEIFSNLFLTGLIGILISILINKSIEKQRTEKDSKSLDLQKKEHEKQLQKLQSKINENVFDALFMKVMPEEIFQVIKRDIIKSDVIRRDPEWLLDFTVENDEITLRLTNRYKAYNNCDKEIVNPVIRVIHNHSNSESFVKKVLCTLHDEILVSYDSEKHENKGVNVEVVDENTQKIHYELRIPAYHYVEYTTVFQNKYKGFVQDELFTLLPQIDLNIIATYPSDYEFRIFPMLSSELKLKLKENNRSIYKVEGGILPNQGVAYILEKKKKENGVQQSV